MMSYLYDVNASNDIQPHPRICNFTQRVIIPPLMLEIFIVLNEKDM